jgi:hypothetical protein
VRAVGVVEQVWRALEYCLEEVEGLRPGEAELVWLPGLTPCLFLSPRAANHQREAAVAHALVLLGMQSSGFGPFVEHMAALVRPLVPALLSGLAGAKLLHICAWDGLTSAIEALLALPNFLRL